MPRLGQRSWPERRRRRRPRAATFAGVPCAAAARATASAATAVRARNAARRRGTAKAGFSVTMALRSLRSRGRPACTVRAMLLQSNSAVSQNAPARIAARVARGYDRRGIGTNRNATRRTRHRRQPRHRRRASSSRSPAAGSTSSIADLGRTATPRARATAAERAGARDRVRRRRHRRPRAAPARGRGRVVARRRDSTRWSTTPGSRSLRRGDVLEVTPESFDRVLGTNLRGTFFLTQAVAKRMLADAPGAAHRSHRHDLVGERGDRLARSRRVLLRQDRAVDDDQGAGRAPCRGRHHDLRSAAGRHPHRHDEGGHRQVRQADRRGPDADRAMGRAATTSAARSRRWPAGTCLS